MYFVYVLKSEKDNNLYTGHTKNIEKRVAYHNSGRVKSTAKRGPFKVLHVEEFMTRSEARWREKKLKTAWGKKKLREQLQIS